MKYYSIPNLRSDAASLFDPRTWAGKYPDLKSKSAFRAWCANIDTKHAFISGVESVNPNERIGVQSPPYKIHSFIVDYDVPVDWPNLKTVLEKKRGSAPMPTWSVKTWSDHLRLVWELEEPLLVTEDTAELVLEQLSKIVNAKKLYAGYDSASTKPSQYYEAGTDWENLGGQISSADALTALFKVGTGKKVVSDVSIPLDIVAAEIAERWPNRWKGEFVEGSRGPLFWIEDGVERDGAMVKADGMICYSDRAGEPFVTWREILGNTFVQKFETKRLVEGVSDIWYDGRDFWITGPLGPIRNIRDNVILHLKMAGFSQEKKKGQKVTEIESALHHIITHNRVDGAAPFVFREERLVIEPDGRRLVNTSRCKALSPAATGEIADWPWLHSFFQKFFDPIADELGCMPLDFWFAWLSRAYQASYYKRQLSGHAVIIAGPPRRGKTLLSQFIVGTLLGGHADASEYLSAKTTFNKALSEVPIWTVDDSVSATNFADHRKFVEMLKKLVANTRIQVEAKYADRTDINWYGRAIITLNEDANSLSMIPTLESSNRDKLMAFRIAQNSCRDFLPNEQQEALIRRELPHFARWLLDYEPNQAVLGSARYGLRSYFHPMVENSARDSSTRQGSTELLDIFLKYYAEANPTHDTWTGTTTQLIVEINRVDELRGFPVVREPMRLQRDLSSSEEYSLSNHSARRIRSESTGSGRIWSIQIKRTA